jgi:predicted CoA-binding protein
LTINEAERITELLNSAKTIAVVGLTDSPMRPSYSVTQYMQSQGYRIIPVNPNLTEWMGEKAYPTLLEIPGSVDIVNVFRRPDGVPEVVDQAIQIKAPAIWLQEGVVHEAAAQKALDAGIFVVMDLCILKEHAQRKRR